MQQTGLVRPFWNESGYHRELWRNKDITVLITQYKSLDITKLTLESLLTFYPDIAIFVINNSPDDISGDYLHYKASKYPNITIWDREGLNSHGTSMDEAIRGHITTKYILTLDSDVQVLRGGWIEDLLEQMKTEGYFATGTLMLVSNLNDACGVPLNTDDILYYAHPSCSIYDRDLYLTMRGFCNHGAPCYRTMQDAQKRGLKIGYYPIDKYVAHLSGAGWCFPWTIWKEDHGVKMRPLVTFIITSEEYLYCVKNQSDTDYDMIFPGNHVTKEVIVHDGEPSKMINNKWYDIRFAVQGDYVCYLWKEITLDFVSELREEATNNDDDILTIDGVEVYRRGYWQYRLSLV